MFKRILFVCTGNICRSPMAEALLRAQSGDAVAVASAGTGALLGHPADAQVLTLLAARGIDASGHRAQAVTLNGLRWADLVLGMETHHLHEIYVIDPAARGKSFLVGHWLGQREIADPYQQGGAAFERTLTELDETLATWLPKL